MREYGLVLRVYKKNNTFAEDDATLASLSEKKVDDISVRSNMLVGNFEANFNGATGLKVQVATGDNSQLVDGKSTLAEARSLHGKK